MTRYRLCACQYCNAISVGAACPPLKRPKLESLGYGLVFEWNVCKSCADALKEQEAPMASDISDHAKATELLRMLQSAESEHDALAKQVRTLRTAVALGLTWLPKARANGWVPEMEPARKDMNAALAATAPKKNANGK